MLRMHHVVCHPEYLFPENDLEDLAGMVSPSGLLCDLACYHRGFDAAPRVWGIVVLH